MKIFIKCLRKDTRFDKIKKGKSYDFTPNLVGNL